MAKSHQEMEANSPLQNPAPSLNDVVPGGESITPPSPPTPIFSRLTSYASFASPQHHPIQNHFPDPPTPQSHNILLQEDFRSLVELIKKQMKQKEDDDLRNTMVVVAVLILSVTYQAALGPPGGTWQDDPDPSNLFMKGKHVAGTPVLRDRLPMTLLIYCFLNKMAFFASMLIIWVCMFNEVSKAVRICKVLVVAAVFMMVATYITGTLLIARQSSKFTTVYETFVHVVAFAVVFAILWLTDFITSKLVKGFGSGRIHNVPQI